MMRLQDSFAPVTGAPADFGLKTAQLVLALRDLAGKNLEETAVQQAAPDDMLAIAAFVSSASGQYPVDGGMAAG